MGWSSLEQLLVQAALVLVRAISGSYPCPVESPTMPRSQGPGMGEGGSVEWEGWDAGRSVVGISFKHLHYLVDLSKIFQCLTFKNEKGTFSYLGGSCLLVFDLQCRAAFLRAVSHREIQRMPWLLQPLLLSSVLLVSLLSGDAGSGGPGPPFVAGRIADWLGTKSLTASVSPAPETLGACHPKESNCFLNFTLLFHTLLLQGQPSSI